MGEGELLAAERRKLASDGWRRIPAARDSIGAEAPSKKADVFLTTQTRWLGKKRANDELQEHLRLSDSRPVAERLVLNARRGRSALLATLELPAPD
jgi:hypothetical protein